MNKISICQQCNSKFEFNLRTGVNWAKKTGRGKFCSGDCYHKSRKGMRVSPATEFKKGVVPKTAFKKGQKAWNFKTGIWSYQKYRKDKCEDCSSIKNLDVHHLDHNRHNNNRSNLKTLCRKCHISQYHIRVAWNKGIKMSQKTREKISLGIKNHYANKK